MPLSLSSARLSSALLAAQLVFLVCGAALAEGKTGQVVPQVPGNYLEQTGAQPRFVRFNQLPLSLTTALRAASTAPATPASVRTIPYFSGAFTFKSTPY